MAFGEGPRVYVRAPDGSGVSLKDVRVERVEVDGTQTVSCEEIEWWDLDVIAEAIEERSGRGRRG